MEGNELFYSKLGYWLAATILGLLVGLLFWFVTYLKSKNLKADFDALQKKHNTLIDSSELLSNRIAEHKSTIHNTIEEKDALSFEVNQLNSTIINLNRKINQLEVEKNELINSKDQNISLVGSAQEDLDHIAKLEEAIRSKDNRIEILEAAVIKSNSLRKSVMSKYLDIKKQSDSHS